MSKVNQVRSLSDLRVRIEEGLVPTPSAMSVLAFLDLAEVALGASFHDCDMLSADAAFLRHFPSEPDEELAQAFGDATNYRRCRESLHRHARLAGLWHEDQYTLLNRLAKEQRVPGLNRKVMEEHFPGIRLSAITRDKALAADRGLRCEQRSILRKSLATMDRFRADPRVVAAGILGPKKIGPMPKYRDGDRARIELPIPLAAVLGRVPLGQAKRARRAFELAVDLSILEEEPTSDIWAMSEVDALRFHDAVREQISDESAQGYLRALISLLRAANSSAVPDHVTVDRVRRPERYTSDANPAPKRKKTDRKPVRLPPHLEAEVSEFAQTHSTSRKRVRSLRKLLRALLDAGYDIDDPAIYTHAQLLFEVKFAGYAKSTVDAFRSSLRTFLAHTNRFSAWPTLLFRAKLIDSADINISGLLLITTFAESRTPTVSPAEINKNVAQDFLVQAQECREVPKCLKGLKSLDALRAKLPNLLPGPDIGDIRDQARQISGEIPETLEALLRSDAEGLGYSQYGVKARIVAVRALYTVARDKTLFSKAPARIPWRALIEDASADHARKLSPYRTEFSRLADQYDRRWSSGWWDLHKEIVAAGIPRAENPVETLMAVALETTLEPWMLDREWAWVHERTLRPDLRRKWTRAITCFDALHDVSRIKESGLLPAQRLGPMPALGSRLKNGHFPLPRRFEAALEGEMKPVLEAAHFIYRCLRNFGVYSCGDDPAPGDLVSKSHLVRIMAEQSFMTAQSARIHVERIHDWRKSWPVDLHGAVEEVATKIAEG